MDIKINSINKKIILANPRGFCAGVTRAISMVEKIIAKYGTPVYVRHELVHNHYVVNNLRKKGVIFVERISEVPDNNILVYSAHGVSKLIQHEANSRNLKMIFDATCPLVSKVHTEVNNLYKLGYKIIIIGHHDHPEVAGTMGQIPNNIYLVECIKDIESLPIAITEKVAVVTQTTLSIDDTNNIIEAIRKKFKNIFLPKKEDICYATQNRQNAIKQIVNHCDILLIVGSKNSSNSKRLQELSEALGVNSYLIDYDVEIQEDWLNKVNTIGVTAGASAPEILVSNVINKLKNYGFNAIEELHAINENMLFALPIELR